MPVNVLMPQMGESITEGTVVRWFKNEGDEVAKDEPLLEISTDKVDAEVPAPASGKLGRILHGPGATVAVETVIGVIEIDQAGETATSAPAPKAVPAAALVPPPVSAAPPAPVAPPPMAPAPAPAALEPAEPTADGNNP